jgi:hypothetical protein
VRLQAEAAHNRRIVVWEKPVSAAIERIDQCVSSAGVVCSVRSMTAVMIVVDGARAGFVKQAITAIL